MKFIILNKLNQKYDEQDYLTKQRAQSLSIINLVGLFLGVIYIIINFILGNTTSDIIDYLLVPFIFIFVMLIALILIKGGKLQAAGNFIITSLIVAQILSVFYNLMTKGNYIALFAGTYYYFLTLLMLGSIYASKRIITINTVFLIIMSFLAIYIAQKNYPQNIVQNIKTSTTDFMTNLIVLYLFLIFSKKLINTAINKLFEEKKKKEEQNITLVALLENMQKTVTELDNNAQKLVKLSDLLSEKSTEQAATTEEVAASTEEITSALESTTETANNTHSISLNSMKNVQESSEIFNLTMQAFMDISDKTDIIKNIADKTDILAVNAAIEAAHAGDAGKGFAVVAAEIRKLSDLAKSSSSQISELSVMAQNKASITKEKFNQIIDDIQKITDFMKNIAASSEEQLKSLHQINTSMNQLSNFAEENTTISEQMVMSANILSDLSNSLKNFKK